MNGLEGVGFYKRFVEKKQVRIVCSPQVREVIWDERLKASMGTLIDHDRSIQHMKFDDYFIHAPLSWCNEIQIGPFTIRSRRTIHHVPTSALFIEAGDRSFGYSSDTAFDPGLISFLEKADLIVHETNFGPAHTPYPDLAALPVVLRDRMRLIHYSDGLENAKPDIRTLHEGEVIQL